MIDADLVIALLAAITLLAGLAARMGTPYPVVLVLGGLVMGLQRAASRLPGKAGTEPAGPDEYASARASIIGAERRRLEELDAQGAYPGSVLRELGHQLDLEESHRR